MKKFLGTCALPLLITLAGCSGDPEQMNPDAGTPTDTGVADTGADPLCGPLNPTGQCASGFQCYAGNCFEDSEFCSAQNPVGLCRPSEDCQGGVCVPRDTLCSAANPTGDCDPGETCRGGQCLDDGLLCSAQNPTGLCPDVDDSCLEGSCVAMSDLCSPQNPNGMCAAGLMCIQGACSTPNPCTPAEPQGFCDPGNTCIEGTCTANTDLCSATNTTGICVSNQTCIDGTCTDDGLLCSAAQPAGLCPMGSVCFDNSCVLEADLCSATNVTGLCEAGQSCVEGNCINDSLLCSPMNPTGTCATGFSCFEGSCTEDTMLCSANNQTGLCPGGEVCNAGVCEPAGSCSNCTATETCLDGTCRENTLLCSQANPTGLCESGFNCIAGVCIDAGVGCSATNQSGVCPTGEICNAGVCEPIDDALLCDDDNPCTRDWFDYPRNRCGHEPQAAACSDGNACTTDTCNMGTCAGTPIGGCIEPPTIDPYVTPTNDAVLNLSGTKPSGSSIDINGLEAVPQNPDTTWSVVLNLVPGTNTYVINSVDLGQASATIQVDVVYDITPPVTSLTPAGGVFLNGITVRVASDEAATVHYTTDGAEPDQFAPSFQSVKEFRVFDTSKLRFRALDQAGNWESAIVTADYEITGHGNGWDNRTTLSQALIHTGATTHGNSVYVAGGSDGLAPQAGAFAYDHVMDAWTTLPSMAGARAQLVLATVGDQVFAIGGENNGGPLGSVEVLDLSQPTLSWTALSPMPSTRFGLSAVVRGNSIHVFGGKTNGGVVLSNHEVFDSVAGTWTNAVAQMPRARYAFGTVIHGDLIYVVGGEDAAGTPIAEVDIYDPVADTWALGASLPTPRSFAATTLLKNEGLVAGGHSGIVVAGGRAAGGTSVAVVHEYIIEDDTWRERTPLGQPRQGGSSVTVLRQGTVDTVRPEAWFLGGQLTSGLSDQVLGFTFSQDHTRTVASMPDARFMHAAAAHDSNIYLFGGRNFTEELDAWVFDPETDSYQMLPALPSFQSGLAAAAVGDFVYAIGGADNFGNSVATVRAYDPVQDMWIARAPMQVARRDAAVTVLGKEIWVVGGFNAGALQTVEVYNTETNTWRSEAVLPQARTGAMAVTRDGDILVMGGLDATGAQLATMIRYNGTAWSPVGTGFGVAHGSAFVIGDDVLTSFGGRASGVPVSDIISYNLATNQLQTALIPSTQLIRPYDFSASTVLFGKVYLFGGNATPAIGPSGEAVAQKIEGRCYNGVLDGREVVGANGYDSEGGCGIVGIEHSTGLGTLFYNDQPVATNSLQRAIDACNVHYNTTTCGRSCSGSCASVTRDSNCSCSAASIRWNFGDSCYSGLQAGTVEAGGSCNGALLGNWY